jgi:hypothetical protein
VFGVLPPIAGFALAAATAALAVRLPRLTIDAIAGPAGIGAPPPS